MLDLILRKFNFKDKDNSTVLTFCFLYIILLCLGVRKGIMSVKPFCSNRLQRFLSMKSWKACSGDMRENCSKLLQQNSNAATLKLYLILLTTLVYRLHSLELYNKWLELHNRGVRV